MTSQKSTRSSATLSGVIGGSGLYQIQGIENVHWSRLCSGFGKASDRGCFGTLHGHGVVFLPRHGRGHYLPPSAINYRANIEGLKTSGCRDILSMSAVGSLKEALPPGTFVIVDQFVDRTFAREKSFFGPGLVAHVSMAQPVCSRLGDHLEAAARSLGFPVVRGGTYLAMEGPQFSTLAESRLYRSWGCDVIGMTNMPEAKLAREAELVTPPGPWSLTSTVGIRNMTTSPLLKLCKPCMRTRRRPRHWCAKSCPELPATRPALTVPVVNRWNTPFLPPQKRVTRKWCENSRWWRAEY